MEQIKKIFNDRKARNKLFITLFFSALVIFLLVFLISGATFTDTSDTNWTAGTFVNTTTEGTGDGANVTLSGTNSSGTFTSQIFNAGGSSTTWNNVSWTPDIPYQTELPDNMEVETSQGGANMTGNVLLMHLNNETGYENSTWFYDWSGNGNNGTCSGTSCPTLTGGKFDTNAYNFSGIAIKYVSIPDSGNEWNFTNRNTTISMWVKFDSSPAGTGLISSFTSGPTEGWQVWMQSASVLRVYDTVAGGKNFAWTPSIGEWHHIILTKDTDLEAFADGVSLGTVSLSNLDNKGSNSLTIGATDTAGRQSINGTIDEVSIWNRSLSSQEVLDLYKRGAMHLNLSVRSCNDNACSGESFSGTYTTNPLILNTTITPDNQYFQYKFDFATENTSYSPKLMDVVVDYVLDVCGCPSSGDWEISDGSACSLTTTCNLGASYFRLWNGSLMISSEGALYAKGCFVNESQSLYIANGGKLMCTG